MAQQIETAATGEQAMDINTWLGQNRLGKYKDKFMEDVVQFQDILTWDEKTIDETSKHYGMSSPVVQKRFKTAVRTLQYKTRPPQSSSHQIYRIVTSIKESASITSLENRLSEIQTAIKNNTDETNKSVQNCKMQNSEIEQIFNSLQHKLNARKTLLLKKLNSVWNDRLHSFQNQQKLLCNYQNLVRRAKEETNALTLDPDIGCTQRETKIIKICDDAIDNINEQQMNIKPDNVSLKFSNEAIYKYIAQIGEVAVERPLLLLECKENETQNVNDNISWSAYSKIVTKFDSQFKGKDMVLSDSDNVVTKSNTTDSHQSALLLMTMKDRNKYHYKFEILSVVTNHYAWEPIIGIVNVAAVDVNTHVGPSKSSYGYYSYKGKGNLYTSITGSTDYGQEMKKGDVIDMFVDMDALTVSYHHNGSNYGKAFDIARGKYKAAVSFYKPGNSIRLLHTVITV